MVARFAIALLLIPGAPAAAQCRLCVPGDSAPVAAARPLNIEVETALDLGRAAAVRQGGSVAVDPRTGARRVEGLTDLGGFALTGRVRITGEPFRRVRVSLPASVALRAPDGSTASATDIRTDLPSDPVLDATGQLSFGFGGRLVVADGASGEFRGRIPVVAEYQ
jgi:Domain of unknown function (DUF4402)